MHVRVHGAQQRRRAWSGIDLAQVFTRFYREERSRAQAKDGHRGAGLGLAITRGFVEAHGGKIWVESDPLTGVTFTFTLPARQPQRLRKANEVLRLRTGLGLTELHWRTC